VLVFCYCISYHHFSVYVENFPSYVPLYLYVCLYGLRLSDLNKETTYLLTYLLRIHNKYGFVGFLLTFDLLWICCGFVVDFLVAPP